MRKRKPSDVKYVAGLDFSISNPAVSILNRETGRITVHSLPSPAATCFAFKIDRWNHIADNILAVMPSFRHAPERCLLFMEDYAFGAVGRTFDIAEAAAIFKWKLHNQYKYSMAGLFYVAISHLKMLWV
jgi:hypothetical protein